MAEIPRAPIERLVKRAGAERVSDGAVDAMIDALEEEAIKIATKAIKLARHAGRKTVVEDDIKLARS
ncbi:MAG: NFYB/HAP3 family transcription factor subunit [Candidatus Micrarchaeota archaeon]|nr:NFYB/HAP3 family transcription factor subunit [Candidatus Micrarchaeota archaeon]